MKKILLILVCIVIASAIYWKTRPSPFDTGDPLLAKGDSIALLAGLNTQTLPSGWAHREFLTVSPADYQMVEDDGKSVMRCATDNSASIFARDTAIPLSKLPILSWRWKVIQPIESDVDEAIREGDDHPVRFYLKFSNEKGEQRSMEIIWSNKKYASGDYKIIGDFYHYVANGLDRNVGQWFDQTVDLRQLYKDIGGTGTATLETLGFFCDSDNTGTKSEAIISDVLLSTR